MRRNLAKAAMDLGEKAAHLGYEAGRVKSVVSDKVSETIEDSIYAAKRAARRGVYAAEDLADETAYRIKQEPLRSVAITLGVGFGIGALFGWIVSRVRKGETSKG